MCDILTFLTYQGHVKHTLNEEQHQDYRYTSAAIGVKLRGCPHCINLSTPGPASIQTHVGTPKKLFDGKTSGIIHNLHKTVGQLFAGSLTKEWASSKEVLVKSGGPATA